MPETFTVDVCSTTPCHWAPPQLLSPVRNSSASLPPPDLPIADEDGGVEMQHPEGVNTAVQGDPVNLRRSRKRAPEPDPQHQSIRTPAQDQPHQGPPLPEWPTSNEDHGRSAVKHNAQSTVDPDVVKLAVERQQASQVQKMISRPQGFHDHMDTRYILRPEAIESVFYMWRITGDQEWQEKGWEMWERIEKVSWTDLAYSAITDVNDPDSPKADSMERYSHY